VDDPEIRAAAIISSGTASEKFIRIPLAWHLRSFVRDTSDTETLVAPRWQTREEEAENKPGDSGGGLKKKEKGPCLVARWYRSFHGAGYVFLPSGTSAARVFAFALVRTMHEQKSGTSNRGNRLLSLRCLFTATCLNPRARNFHINNFRRGFNFVAASISGARFRFIRRVLPSLHERGDRPVVGAKYKIFYCGPFNNCLPPRSN